MSASIGQSIDVLCKEKGIDRELVVEAMKDAVRAAAKKHFKNGEEIYVEWSNDTGIELFAAKTVVEEVTNPAIEISLTDAVEMAGEDVLTEDKIELGDELQLPLPMEDMGRIAAQTAKQILFQKVRDAERANIYEQYVDKIGDLLSGFVKRFERGDMIVDLGTVEAILPRREQSRGEQWAQGERIRVVINNVQKEAKGPQVEVSRTSPEMLRRLFEMEVPEIYDETVVIKNAVREPGERAKIAVTSNERDVDPVGACVGMKGSRVQAIIRELRGEKIDIIEWSDEPSVFAANALSPAKVNQVHITDIERRQMEVIVNEDQLSLAIGKHGQNVRLATKLVGWNIDIRSEEDLKKQIAAQMGALIRSGEAVPLTALETISPQLAEQLAERNITDIDQLAATPVDDLVEYLDVSLDEAERLLDSARSIISARDAVKEEEASTEVETQASEDAQSGDAASASSDVEASGNDATSGEASVETPDADDAGEAANGSNATAETEIIDVTAEDDEGLRDDEPEDPTEAGYDEAVRTGVPFAAEETIKAEDSADPVAMTEADPMSADELMLQDAGRDLRPDTITPAPDVTSTGAADLEENAERDDAAQPANDSADKDSAA